MSVRFSCAVCRVLFCVPVCSTVLGYVSGHDLMWNSGLCWADWLWLFLKLVFLSGRHKTEKIAMGYQAFCICKVLLSFWAGPLRTFFAYSSPLTSFEGHITSWALATEDWRWYCLGVSPSHSWPWYFAFGVVLLRFYAKESCPVYTTKVKEDKK